MIGVDIHINMHLYTIARMYIPCVVSKNNTHMSCYPLAQNIYIYILSNYGAIIHCENNFTVN